MSIKPIQDSNNEFLFPNPTKQNGTFMIRNHLAQDFTLEVFDLSSKKVSFKLLNPSTFQIDKPGIYQVNLSYTESKMMVNQILIVPH